MAKATLPPPPPQQGKMTFMVVSFQGNDETMQKGIEAMTAAVGHLLPQHHTRSRIANVPTQSGGLPAPAAPAAEETNGHVEEPAAEDFVDGEVAPVAAVPANKTNVKRTLRSP